MIARMTDDELRRLERAYREGGQVEAHARWIAARVRAGDLGAHRVRLAAALGHEAAARALGVARGRPGAGTVADVADASRHSRAPQASAEAQWILSGQGAPPPPAREPALDEDLVHARVVLAAAREALVAAGVQDAEVVAALESLGAWVGCPCAAHRGALLEQVARARRFMSEEQVLECFVPAERPRIQALIDQVRGVHGADAGPGPFVFDAWWTFRITPRLSADLALSRADACLAFEVSRTRRGAALLAARGALDAWQEPQAADRAVLAAAFVAGEDEVRDAVVASVGPWLLREEAPGD